MAISKNFLTVVSLMVVIAGVLVVHPLTSDSDKHTVDTVAGQTSELRHLH